MEHNEENVAWAIAKLDAFSVFPTPKWTQPGFQAYVAGFLRMARNEPCEVIDGRNDVDWIIEKMINESVRFPMIAEMRAAYDEVGLVPWDVRDALHKKWHEGKYAKGSIDDKNARPPQ
jgi:hypothetical protein